jgi:hypothetical protein
VSTPKLNTDQPGAIPVSALHGRASASADAARLAQIRADLALTPLERVKKALDLGAARLEQTSRAGENERQG